MHNLNIDLFFIVSSSNCKNLTNVQSDSRRQSIVSNVNSARLAFSAGRVPGWPSASNMRRSVFKINKTLGIRGGYDKFYELLLSRRRTVSGISTKIELNSNERITESNKLDGMDGWMKWNVRVMNGWTGFDGYAPPLNM